LSSKSEEVRVEFQNSQSYFVISNILGGVGWNLKGCKK